MHTRIRKEKHPPGLQTSLDLRDILLQKPSQTPKRPRDDQVPGSYKEALDNFKISIFRETYPEDRITEEDRDSILEILGEELSRTPLAELPRLKSYRLDGGAIIYTCVDQQSGHWLIKTIDNHGLAIRGNA
jgi:hypothetical protein